MRKQWMSFTLALSLGTLAGTSMVLAHATLETDQAPANSTYKAVLRVPHGCEGQATHTVRIQIPEGFIAVKPMPKPGWKLEAKEGAYAKTYDYFGTPMAKGVREVVWSGGDLPDAFYDEFVFRGRIAEHPEGTMLWFKTVQECANGAERWIEIPAAGQNADDLKHPAPGLKVTAAKKGGH